MHIDKKLIFIFVVFFSTLIILFFIFYNQKQITDQKTIPTEKKVEISKKISLLFIGDIMLDRTIRKDGELYGYPNLFSCLKEEFSKYNAIIGNLEGTITNFDSVSKNAAYESPESFRFTFDTDSIYTLKDIGLSIVSLGNNHIKDFGNIGIDQTIQNLNNIKLFYFGNPQKNTKRYLIQKIGDTEIAFISYNQFFGTKKETLEDIQSTQSVSDLQIIFTHWGEEYVSAKEYQKNLAREFVDAGADLIIGTHPHVIQEKEIYKNIYIYYSLGNFIFDQYWEESVRNGMGVVISIENNKTQSIQEIYFESKRHQGTCLKR